MSLLPCTCGAARALAGRTPQLLLARSIASSRAARFPLVDQAPDDPAVAARRQAEQDTGRRNVGPFPFVDQPGSSSSGNPRIPWNELERGEKVGRSLVNSSNLFVVLFGVTITGLVIYAVSSELFADNSPTRLYEEAVKVLEKNKEMHEILTEPIKFHAESSGGRRNRRVRSTLSVDRPTGREKMTIRFFADGKSANEREAESYTARFKRWIRPIVVEPSHDSGVLVPSPPAAATSRTPTSPEESTASSWIGSMFGSLLPSAYSNKGQNSVDPAGPPRMRTKPPRGTFSSGEAVVSLLMDDKGKFKLDSLVVYYPDAQQWQWKTDVHAQQHVQLEAPAQEGPTRYRFWSRKA